MSKKAYKKDLTGRVYSRLTVLDFHGRLIKSGNSAKTFPYWNCICECGKLVVVAGGSLQSGNTKSCGCLKIERVKSTGFKNKRHGQTDNLAYGSWHSMKRRCLKKESPRYSDYGERGISICNRWLEPGGKGFLNFLEDMGPRPSKAYSLDRVDVNGDYNKENCKWSTITEQNNNKRCHKNKSKYGIGIYLSSGGFSVYVRDKYIGYYKTVELAQLARVSYLEENLC